MPPLWRLALLLCSASATIAAADLEDIKKRETNQGENMLITIVSAEMKNQFGTYPSSNLIDGDLDSFAHTSEAEDGMWMRVNLEKQYSVTKVIIYNRVHSCCQDRIVGASVFIKTGDEHVTDCGTISRTESSYTFNCEGDGNVIELSQEGTVGVWNIAEIQVYGTPSEVTCTRPAVSDATITPAAETIGDGEVYTIKCDEELIDITDADGASSRKATCDAGKLSKLPICAACNVPSNMGVYTVTNVTTPGTFLLDGDSVTVSCEHNLVNFGSDLLTCATGDKFQFDFQPECLSKVPITETKTSSGVSVPAVNDDSNLENIQWVRSNEQEVWIEVFFDSINAISIVKVFNKDGCMASDSYDLKISAKRDDQYILDCGNVWFWNVGSRSRTKRYDCALQFRCGSWFEATSIKITDANPTYDGENVVMKITEVIIGRAASMSVGITTEPTVLKETDNNDVSIICTVKYDPLYFFEGFTLRVQHFYKDVAGVQPKQISSKDLKDGCSYSEEELVYTIPVANKGHNGPYRCKATKWKSITLTLAFVIKVAPVIPSIKTYRCREVIFTCKIHGDKPRAIKWFKDQSEISAVAPYEIYVTSADSYSVHSYSASSLGLVWNGTLVVGYSTLVITPEGTKTAKEVQYRCEVYWDLNGNDVLISTHFNLLVHDVYVGLEEREVMTGTTTTLSCVVDAPPETTTPFDITWTGGDVTWDSKNPTTISDYSISAGVLVDQGVDDNSAAPRRRRQVTTLEVLSAAVVHDLQYTCTVDSTTFNLENADDKYYLNLGVYDVTPVSKNVYRGDFSSETISCVVTNMVSTEHTILWQPDDTMSGEDITWISPSVTSELTLKKDLVTDDHVYRCEVQATTKSEPASIEVHLNFYSIEISQSVEIRTLSEAVTLTCKVTEISHDMSIAWLFTPNYMSELMFHQEFDVESSLKFSELNVVREATEQDRAYTCRVSSTQQTFTTSTAREFTVDLNVYDVNVINKDIQKDSIGEQIMITCEVSGISVDPEIIWSNTDQNGAVQDSDAGTFVNNRKTSVLTVTLNSAEDTQFFCKIESDETKKLTGTQETAAIFVYDVEPKSTEVIKNTEAKISCTITDISAAMKITWSELITSGDTTPISVSDTFYPKNENQISIITVTSEVATSDKVFTCTVSSLQNPTSDQTNFQVELKVYDVAVNGREVSKGTTTTLTCVVSNLSQIKLIQWHDEADKIQASVHVDEDITAGGSQRSTLTIPNPTESKVFTCRVFSTLYPDSPPSDTPVQLYVYEVAGPSIEVKTGVTVTLILTISNVREIGVTVTWKDSSGNVLDVGTESEYSEEVQVSTLSLQNVQLESVYTCAVNSKEFAESESADHVITLKTYDVIPSPDHLVKTGTEVTLSCEISDLDEAVSVEWLKDTTVISHGGDYTVSLSNLESGKQTATLLIGGAAVKQDSDYTCRVKSIQYDSSPYSDTQIRLEVYEVEMTSQAVIVGGAATITCAVTGLGSNTAEISWLPDASGPVSTGDLDTNISSRTSTLTIAKVTQETYNINFICVVKSDSEKYSNSPASNTEKHVNSFSVEVSHREVKKNTETEISCTITEIGAAMEITWTGYTNKNYFNLSPAVAIGRDSESQTSTLIVGSEAVVADATYTCTVSSVVEGNLFETKNFDVQLFVYDVNVHDREVAKGTTTTLTCIASELTQEMEIKWILEDVELVSSNEYTVTEVNNNGLYESQESKLTILNPTKSEDFTCRVSSTLYPESPSSETVVHLYVFDIAVTGVEVKQGEAASLTCTVTNFLTRCVTVEWKYKQVTVIEPTDYNEVSVLSLKDVQSDSVYTCVVKSKEFPESEATEETVNLKTYVVTPKHRQVKMGTEITLFCEISDLDKAVSVEWLKDTTVISHGGDYTVSQGSLESGKQIATLMINTVTADTVFTFRVQSIQYDNSPSSDTEVTLRVYGVENLQKAVLVGDPAYLTCKLVGLSSNDVEISWLPSNSGTSTPGNLDTTTGVKISTLTISNPQTDNTYTCLVKSELYPDSPPSETEQRLDTFGVKVTNKEVKSDTETSMSCTITDIKTDMRITWSGYLDTDIINYSTNIDDSVSGSRSNVLTIKSGAVSTDRKFTCTVQSVQSLVSEIKTFDVQLLVYSVHIQNGIAASASTFTLTCIISDLTQEVTIEWRLGDNKLETEGNYLVDVVDSIHTDRSQISHLTILQTTQSEVFTCQVASTLYLESPVSETLVYLDVYDVEVQDREVVTGTTTTLTCIVSSLIKRAKSVSVVWLLGSEELNSNIVNVFNTDGSQITSKLTIPNPTKSETFTCKVSLDSPISSTPVHLYVYGITEGTGVEVKQGDTVSLTCAVSNIRQTGVTMQWIDSSGSVTETVDSSTGAQISVLSLEDVQSDSFYTCVVKSKEFPDSESTEETFILKTYAVKPKDQEVEPGSDVTLSCEITDLDSTVNVAWVNEAGDIVTDGEQYTVTHSQEYNWDHVTTLALEGSTVTEDLSFTCRVKSVEFSNSPSSDTVVKLVVNGVCMKEVSLTLGKFGKGPWVFNETRGRQEFSIACTDGYVRRACLRTGQWDDIESSSCTLLVDKINREIDSLGEEATFEQVESVVNNLSGMDEYVKDNPHKAGQVINSLSKLNSKFRVVKTPNAVDLKKAVLGSVSSVQNVNKQSNILKDEDKQQIIPMIEALAQSVDSTEGTLVNEQITVKSVSKSNEPITLEKPSEMKGSAVMFDFGRNRATRATVAVMAEDFMGILPQPLSNGTMESPVISVNFMEQEGEGSAEFTIHFPKEANKSSFVKGIEKNYTCVYLDTVTSEWKGDGCVISYKPDGGHTCSCNHTTSFAVLLSLTDVTDPYQDLVSYIMLGVNMFFLLITFLLVAPFRELRRKQLAICQVNLILSLLLANAGFTVLSSLAVVTVDHRGMPMLSLNTGCVTGAIIVQYLFLCSFSWMACTAYTLHSKIVDALKSFGRSDPYYMLKCALISWVSPGLLPLTAFTVSYATNYRRDQYDSSYVGKPGAETGSVCWVENPWRLYTFMLPCYLILMVDAGCFVMIARVVIKSAKAGSNPSNLEKAAKALFAVGASVGLPWVFAALTIIKPLANVFQYIFIILAGLQGPLLFVSLVILQDDIKIHTLKLFGFTLPKKGDRPTTSAAGPQTATTTIQPSVGPSGSRTVTTKEIPEFKFVAPQESAELMTKPPNSENVISRSNPELVMKEDENEPRIILLPGPCSEEKYSNHYEKYDLAIQPNTNSSNYPLNYENEEENIVIPIVKIPIRSKGKEIKMHGFDNKKINYTC
ncbi:titin-like [Bolinopsis microptera]|uniref:titin-like n=1 Tax=Bolinopsis microptera TaxID=2820187 RepID=UPI00307A4A69